MHCIQIKSSVKRFGRLKKQSDHEWHNVKKHEKLVNEGKANRETEKLNIVFTFSLPHFTYCFASRSHLKILERQEDNLFYIFNTF